MHNNNALGTAIINVVPNMDNFVSEMRRQLSNTDFTSIGKEIGKDISRGMEEALDLQGAVESSGNGAMVAASFLGGALRGTMFSVLKGMANAFAKTTLFASLTAAAVKFGKAIAAVAAVVGTFALAWSLLGDKIRPIINFLNNQFSQAWSRVTSSVEMLRAAWANLMQALQPLLAVLKVIAAFLVGDIILAGMVLYAKLTAIGTALANVFAGALQGLAGAINMVAGLINGIVGLLSGNREKIRLGVEQITQGFSEGLLGFFTATFGAVEGFVSTLLGFFNGLGEAIFGAARMETFRENMYATFKGLYESLPGPIQRVISLVSGIGDAAMGAVMSNERLRAAQEQHKAATEVYSSTLDDLRRSLDAVRDAEDALSGAQLDAEGAALAVERAQLRYNQALERYGVGSLEAREAAHSLERANRSLESANDSVAQATREYEGAQRNSTKASAAHTVSAAKLSSAQKEYEEATRSAERETNRFSNTMQSAGRSIVSGLLSGINSAASTIAARMSDIAQGALNAARSRLGINSPSREFMKIGQGICSGLIDGLNSGLADVIKAACGISDSVMEAFDVAPMVQLEIQAANAAAISVAGAMYTASDYNKIARGIAAADSCRSCKGGATMNFYTPVTGYHEVLAANRSIQRQVARGR